jgi:hypothetical protein
VKLAFYRLLVRDALLDSPTKGALVGIFKGIADG